MEGGGGAEGISLFMPGENKKSGCCVLDVVFRQPFSNWDAIQFSNKHTYSISILFQSKACTNWKVLLLDYVLMLNPHSVGKGCENWVTLLRDDLLYQVDNVTRLRILLKQPSPHFTEFGITNFALVYAKDKKTEVTSRQQLKYYEIDLLQYKEFKVHYKRAGPSYSAR